MSQPGDAGVIYDIGFRHYTGPRLGRGYLLRSLYAESLKGAYGLSRSARSKVMPFLLLTVITLPALIMAVVTGVTKASKLPLPYTSYPVALALVISVYLASQAPASVSRDLRFRVMPLYFSRPLRRNDYVLAKYSAMTTAVFILIAVPLTVLYAGALLAKLPFWAQTRGYLSAVLGAVLFALVLSGIGLLIASITPKRGFGVAAIITVLIVLGVVVAILQGLADNNGKSSLGGYLGMLDPTNLVYGDEILLLGADPTSSPAPPSGATAGVVYAIVTVAVVAGWYGALLLRYRKVAAA